MDLYIIRHGAASDIDREIGEESYRYLTVHGRNHCRIVAQKLKDLKVEFDQILTSPLVRAVQTAEIFASVLKYNGEVKTAIELIGGQTYAKFMQMLKRNSHNSSIALFSHAPDVNTFALNLVKGTQSPQLNFKNCSVCKIDYDFENEKGRFVWFLNSEDMKLTEA